MTGAPPERAGLKQSASGKVHHSPVESGRSTPLGFDGKVFGLPAFLKGGHEPPRLAATPRPCVAFVVAVLDCHGYALPGRILRRSLLGNYLGAHGLLASGFRLHRSRQLVVVLFE